MGYPCKTEIARTSAARPRSRSSRLPALVALGLLLGACQASRTPTAEGGPSGDESVLEPVRFTAPVGAPTDGGAAAAPSLDTVHSDLKLVSFNIRLNTSSDGVDAWPNRRAQVYALMKTLAPDVAGLQEAFSGQINDILGGVPGYASLGVGRDDGVAAGEFSPLLYRTARFRADTSGTFWFSDTPTVPGSKSWGNSITRICTWARFVDRNSGKAFWVFNVHLDHQSQPSREKSVQLLVQRIGLVPHASEPVFVTGDFNVGESDPVIRFMKGTAALEGKTNPIAFRDTYREANPNATVVGTFHSFQGTTTGAKIDYVFALPRIRTVAAEINRSNQNGRYPSDHFPVTAAVGVPEWLVSSIRH